VKLVVAIVQDKDAAKAVDELVSRGFGATRINTAGGFFRRGNATILTGVEDKDTQQVIQIVRDTCGEGSVSPEGIRAAVCGSIRTSVSIMTLPTR